MSNHFLLGVPGRLNQIRDNLATLLNRLNQARADRLDANITSRQADWGATQTHRDRLDTNIGSRASQGAVNTLLNRLSQARADNLDRAANRSQAWERSSPGSYTLTVPQGVTAIVVTAVAGGGGGGAGARDGSNNTNHGGEGGGSGYAVARRAYAVTAGQSLDIQVGAGGAGAVIYDGDSTLARSGGDGGNTTIAGLLVLPGGVGGGADANIYSSDPTEPGPGGAGYLRGGGLGYGSAGHGEDLPLSAPFGERHNGGTPAGDGGTTTRSLGAGGAASLLAKGGDGAAESYVSDSVTAQSGTKGAGGGGVGGGNLSTGTSIRAGDGGDGYVLIEWVS
ncbi:glycine-rich domain-containing protein [Arhodomonas sp. AD133]|uniref:glycine-rich domain-containing protein n=1 Tax=Arhodomonas sp. AD133 TaxID=3415009 RepID=UPI003EBC2BA4